MVFCVPVTCYSPLHHPSSLIHNKRTATCNKQDVCSYSIYVPTLIEIWFFMNYYYLSPTTTYYNSIYVLFIHGTFEIVCVKRILKQLFFLFFLSPSFSTSSSGTSVCLQELCSPSFLSLFRRHYECQVLYNCHKVCAMSVWFMESPRP